MRLRIIFTGALLSVASTVAIAADDQTELADKLLHKIGIVEDSRIHRTGITITHDWSRFFVRLAFDPYVNFTPENMWRLSVGTRF